MSAKSTEASRHAMTPMDEKEHERSDLQCVIRDARDWLANQPEPVKDSATWYGFNNLRAFLSQIEADHSPLGLERACHALGWHISDQYGLYSELPTIANFNDRVRLIARTTKSGVKRN